MVFQKNSPTITCQCPLGLISHFYELMYGEEFLKSFKVSMPSRAYISFLQATSCDHTQMQFRCVNALSGLYLISTMYRVELLWYKLPGVNALSGLYLISTHLIKREERSLYEVSMPSRAYISFLRRNKPIKEGKRKFRVNALSGLYLISTVPLQKPRFYAVSRACFCRYLSEYSDNSRFSCMLTFWTYLMRCTYP